MRPNNLIRRVALPFAGLLPVLLAGCVPLGYAYPTVAWTPTVSVQAPADEVRAFRVDGDEEEGSPSFAGPGREVLRPLALGPDGTVPPQLRAAVDYGWVWHCIALCYDHHLRHAVAVRLYRRGWQTVEVGPRQLRGQVAWRQAATAEEQEQAVDALLRLRPQGWHGPEAHLAPGSRAAGHREVLAFAAEEYERLAGLPGREEEGRRRAAEKAAALRQLAER